MVDDSQHSEFDSSFSNLFRLNAWLAQAEEAGMTVDVDTWFNCLGAALRCMIGSLNEKERVEYIRRYRELNYLKMSHAKRRSPYMKLQSRADPELYDALFDYDCALRIVAQSKGLLMKQRDDPTRALR